MRIFHWEAKVGNNSIADGYLLDMWGRNRFYKRYPLYPLFKL